MSKKDSVYYMKLCRKALMEISVTPPDQGWRFLALKKKAQKYLEKAKDLVASEKAAKGLTDDQVEKIVKA